MKRIFYVLFFTLLGALYSCSFNDNYTSEVLDKIMRDTISVELNFYKPNYAERKSKAPLNIEESAISNLNIYVFNKDGAVISHKYIEGRTKVDSLVVHKGESYTLYAVANAGVSIPCTTLAQVEELTISINSIEELVNGVGAVLMSGKSSLVKLNDGSNVDISLSRSISKLSLAFNYSGLDDGVSITIKRAQLFNAPNSIKLFGRNAAVGGGVIDGELYEESNLGASTIPFYLFENMQGDVALGALDNKSKETQMSREAKENSSYIELEYEYSSLKKRGTIVYRFYIGESHSDCNIIRNTNYLCTVYFKGDGSADENSWSVDNSELIDLVTSISLSPVEYEFSLFNDTKQIEATILPATANNRVLKWGSSNCLVATVNSSGVVTSISDGRAVITATSTDNTNISAVCNVTVIQPILEFPNSGIELYPEEEAFIPFAKLVPNDVLPNVSLSLEGLVEVVDISAKGITVRGVAVGDVVLTASTYGVSDSYNINVVPLEVEIYAISAEYGADRLLDMEYSRSIESKNVYGVRPVRNDANIEFVSYRWESVADISLLDERDILRETKGTNPQFTAQATKLTSNTAEQRGTVVITATVVTKNGVECVDKQPLQIFEYAPLFLYWKDGNDTEYIGDVEGIVYVMLTTNQQDPDPKFVYNSITASTEGINTIPFEIICTRASFGIYLDEPWSRVEGEKIIEPRNYDEYRNYFNGVEIALWDYGNSLYYVYEGNIVRGFN